MTIYRIMLDGRHVASAESKDHAEALAAGWLREWDGDFRVVSKQVNDWPGRDHTDEGDEDD